jgi:hypothetical protein
MVLRRIASGEYETTDGTWTVSKLDFGWVASYTKDKSILSDPLPTLREAKAFIVKATVTLETDRFC